MRRGQSGSAPQSGGADNEATGLRRAKPPPISTNRSAWDSSISAGLSLTKGNSDTLLTTVTFKTRRKTAEDELTFGADGSYGENDNVKNNETLHGVGQYNHLFSERFYGYLNAEGLHDGIADLNYRFTISPGAGYYLLKETNTTLAVEAGPGLIVQRLGGVDTTYATLRLAEQFEHKLDNGARVWEKVEFLPQVNKLRQLSGQRRSRRGSIAHQNLEPPRHVAGQLHQPARARPQGQRREADQRCWFTSFNRRRQRKESLICLRLNLQFNCETRYLVSCHPDYGASRSSFHELSGCRV